MNYTIPIALGEVTRGRVLKQEADLKKSIHQNINLILRSLNLSYSYDPSFGSLMNKFQAATPPQRLPERLWRDEMRDAIQKNLKLMLSKYETRIDVKDVYVDLKKSTGRDKAKMNVRIQISGNLSLGRKEKFHYPDSMVSDEAQEVFPLMIPVGKGN